MSFVERLAQAGRRQLTEPSAIARGEVLGAGVGIVLVALDAGIVEPGVERGQVPHHAVGGAGRRDGHREGQARADGSTADGGRDGQMVARMGRGCLGEQCNKTSLIKRTNGRLHWCSWHMVTEIPSIAAVLPRPTRSGSAVQQSRPDFGTYRPGSFGLETALAEHLEASIDGPRLPTLGFECGIRYARRRARIWRPLAARPRGVFA